MRTNAHAKIAQALRSDPDNSYNSNGVSQLALVKPDGTHTIVLTAADGLSNPTAVAIDDETIYVTSAAYITRMDPNLLLAQL